MEIPAASIGPRGRSRRCNVGAILVPTLLLYLLVALWPQPPDRARFIRFEPTGHIGVGR